MALYKRGEIYWCNFMVAGVKVQKSLKTADRRQAKKRQEELKAKTKLEVLRHGVDALKPKEQAMSITEAISRADREHWCHTKDGQKTVNRLTALADLMGDCELCLIDHKWIEKAKATLLDSGRGKSTCNRYMANLSHLLHRACDHWHEIDSVPKIQLYKEPVNRVRTVTDDEFHCVLDCLRRKGAEDTGYQSYFMRCSFLFEVLCNTGMRLSEALNLNSKTIDLDNRVVYVNATDSKSGKTRAVPMTDRVHEILSAYKDGMRLKDHQAERAWRYARDYIGLTHDNEFVIHCLRHTFASKLVEKGVNLYVVKELLGHSSIKTTERYAHVNNGQLTEAINNL